MSNTTLPPEKVKEIRESSLLFSKSCSPDHDQYSVMIGYRNGAIEEAEKAHEGAQAQQLIIHQLSADLKEKDAEIARLKKEIEFLNAKW